MKLDDIIDFYLIESEFKLICDQYNLDYDELINESWAIDILGWLVGTSLNTSTTMAIGAILITIHGKSIVRLAKKLKKKYDKTITGCDRKYQGINSELCVAHVKVEKYEKRIEIFQHTLEILQDTDDLDSVKGDIKKIETAMRRANRRLTTYKSRIIRLEKKGAIN